MSTPAQPIPRGAEPRHKIPAGTKAWTAAEDAILIAGYKAHGYRWCREQLPGRSECATRQRACKIGATHTVKSVARVKKQQSAEKAAAIAERRRMNMHADAKWQAPAPRYPSVWAMAQGVTA